MLTKLTHIGALVSINATKSVKYFSTSNSSSKGSLSNSKSIVPLGSSNINVFDSIKSITTESDKYEPLSNIIEKVFSEGQFSIVKLYFSDDLIGNTMVSSNYHYLDLEKQFPRREYKKPITYLDEKSYDELFSKGFLIKKPGRGSPLDLLIATKEIDGTPFLIGIDAKHSNTPVLLTSTFDDLFDTYVRASDVFRYIGKGGERPVKFLFLVITNREVDKDDEKIKKRFGPGNDKSFIEEITGTKKKDVKMDNSQENDSKRKRKSNDKLITSPYGILQIKYK